MATREGNGNPLQYLCLENPMDRGAWWATIHGVAKSRTQLSDFCVCVCLCVYWPIRSSILAWRTPSPTEKPGSPQSTGLQTVRQDQSDPPRINTRVVCLFFFFFTCGSSAPVRVECDGDAAAWLAGTLAAPSVQGQGRSLPQELWLLSASFSSLW